MAETELKVTTRQILRALTFAVVVLIVCIIVLAVQTQKKNSSIVKIDRATVDIQRIASEFEKTVNIHNTSQRKEELEKAFVGIQRIQVQLDELTKEVKQ